MPVSRQAIGAPGLGLVLKGEWETSAGARLPLVFAS